MSREESPMMRAARQTDLDWDITTSVFVLMGVMAAIWVVGSGLILILDTLAALVGA